MPMLSALSPAAVGIIIAGGLVSVAVFGGNGSGGFCGSTTPSTGASSAQSNQDLNAAIKTVSTVHGHVDSQLAVSMHYGNNIETSGNINAVNHSGGDQVGPWQIYLRVHPEISRAEAFDPVTSTNFMAGPYRKALVAFNRAHAEEWRTDPMAAADAVAAAAEVPAIDYIKDPQRANDIQPAFQNALNQLKESGISTDLVGGSAGSTIQEVSYLQGGCQSPENGSTEVLSPDTSNVDARETALVSVQKAIGLPYVWDGGNGRVPTHGVCVPGPAANDCHLAPGYDCSGLTEKVLRDAGVDGLQHSAAQQYQVTKGYTTATSLDDLSKAQPGDLVFFSGSDGSLSDPSHVGIYIGNGRMIDAPESGEFVRIDKIVGSSFWESEFVAMTDPYRWAASRRAA